MRTYRICIIEGDGIGPEVVKAALKVAEVLPLKLIYDYAEAGFGAYKKYVTPLPQETIDKIKRAQAVFFGAITTPVGIPNYKSPIVAIRKQFDLYANLRPVFSIFNPKIDFVIVRENTEGLYVGKEKEVKGGVVSERILTHRGCRRILKFAFQLAKKLSKKLTVVHKANVIRKGDGLFLQVKDEVQREFPEVEVEEMLVDSCAYKIVKSPESFGVIVTTNMFGDILSDLAAGLTEGLGVLPSANIGKAKALFEPVHGSAPKYKGKDKANPSAAIFSFALMLKHLGEERLGSLVERAVKETILSGKATFDLGGNLSCSEFSRAVRARLEVLLGSDDSS